MKGSEVIHTVVDNARRRFLLQHAINWFGIALCVAAAVWLGTLVAFKLLPLPERWVWSVGIVGLAATFAVFVAGFLRRSDRSAAARWLDETAGLKDRLSSALELDRTDTDWSRLIHSDALAHAQKLDTAKLIPIRLKRPFHIAVGCLTVGAGLQLLPEFRSASWRQQQREAAVIKDVGQNLVQVLQRQAEQKTNASPIVQAGIENAIDLGKELERAKLSRPEALKELSTAAEKVREQLKEMTKAPGLRQMARSSQSSSKTAAASPEMQRRAEALQKETEKNAEMDKAMEKLQADLQKAQEAAAAAMQQPGGMSEEAKQQLAQSLSQMAKQAASMGQSMPDLEKAIKDLQQGNSEAFLRDLNLATKDLEQLRDLAKQLANANQSAEKMGKDLAEQLKNGQAEQAKASLEKMAEMLKNGQLTKEQMAQIAKQVADSVKQGERYSAKLGEMLKKAAGECNNPGTGKDGQKAASASLSEAAKELQRLMEQMGDAESLMAELEALNRAQMAVGHCKSWGQCMGPPKAGQGGKPGRGVGTWAEEGGMMYFPEQTELWDNTGIERPDMDGRGHTDRGDGQLAENLDPTKLKGRLNPGGPMPSVTLKGVSIKGTSKVEVEQAMAAAQSDARAALSDEKVPRAYRGAVKDYFDDIKK